MKRTSLEDLVSGWSSAPAELRVKALCLLVEHFGIEDNRHGPLYSRRVQSDEIDEDPAQD